MLRRYLLPSSSSVRVVPSSSPSRRIGADVLCLSHYHSFPSPSSSSGVRYMAMGSEIGSSSSSSSSASRHQKFAQHHTPPPLAFRVGQLVGQSLPVLLVLALLVWVGWSIGGQRRFIVAKLPAFLSKSLSTVDDYGVALIEAVCDTESGPLQAAQNVDELIDRIPSAGMRRQVLSFKREGDGSTALMLAASAGFLDVVKILLRHGDMCDPLAKTQLKGMTCLHIAAGTNKSQVVVEELAAQVPELLLTTSGQTNALPLHVACYVSREGHTRALIKAAIREDEKQQRKFGHPDSCLSKMLSTKDENSLTPLHVAAGAKARGCVRQLLDAGADPSVKAEKDGGKLPVECTTDPEIHDMLEKALQQQSRWF